MNFIDDRRMQTVALSERMTVAQEHCLALSSARLNAAVGKLGALNPLAVLARGYSALYDENGAVIQRIDQLSEGQTVTLRMTDGEADAEVRSVRKGKETV